MAKDKDGKLEKALKKGYKKYAKKFREWKKAQKQKPSTSYTLFPLPDGYAGYKAGSKVGKVGSKGATKGISKGISKAAQYENEEGVSKSYSHGGKIKHFRGNKQHD